MKSLIIAFATYSRIPMPRVEWEKESMRYSLCFFPLVGGVLGLCSMGAYFALLKLGAGKLLMAAFLTILPILFTGGIHMDGFLDTVDAKSSYRPAEEKLRILKDSNAGAFAVIYGGVYLLICFGLFSEINRNTIALVALSYVYSRVLSGLSVVLLKKARKEGMAADSAGASEKKVIWILAAEGVVCAVVFLLLQFWNGIGCVLAGIACFWYYKKMAYREFGGITGDLAGYFLQVCEGLVLFAIVMMEKITLILK